MAVVARATIATGSTHGAAHAGRRRAAGALNLESMLSGLSLQSSHAAFAQRDAPRIKPSRPGSFVFATRADQRFEHGRAATRAAAAAGGRAFSPHAPATSFRLNSAHDSETLGPSQLTTLYAYFDEKLREEKRARESTDTLLDRVDAHKHKDNSKGLCRGDYKMREIDRMLHSLKINYSRDQMMFFQHMKQAVMPAVYKEEWEANAARVMEMHKIDRVGRFCMFNTPRRMGKTTAVAAFVVSVLIGAPGIEISVFSTGQRASSSLMETVKRMMSVIPELQRRICREDQENLYMAAKPLPQGCSAKSEAANRARTLTTTSRLHSFPDSVEGQFKHRARSHTHTHTYRAAMAA